MYFRVNRKSINSIIFCFQAANTIHIFVEPVSKIQVSAKEIRSRIFGGGSHKPETPIPSGDWVMSSPGSSTTTTTTTDAEILDSTHLTNDESFTTTHEKSTMDER
jgi:hypothetical protein